MDAKAKKPMTIDEFRTFSQPEMWKAIKGNNKTFMDCHHEIFAKTGIWIEELVPIFQKLDANLSK
jgi:hypothetical protein